jgi:hypothetical protein
VGSNRRHGALEGDRDRWDLRWIELCKTRLEREGEEEKTLVDLDLMETLVSFSDDRPTDNKRCRVSHEIESGSFVWAGPIAVSSMGRRRPWWFPERKKMMF